MVSHVVLLKPRSNLSPADRDRLIAAFEQALAHISSIRDVRIGRRFRHGAGYEADMPDAVEFLVMIDFDDAAGLSAYLRHPAHVELAARFAESLASALVYDFEDVRLDDLRDVT